MRSRLRILGRKQYPSQYRVQQNSESKKCINYKIGRTSEEAVFSAFGQGSTRQGWSYLQGHILAEGASYKKIMKLYKINIIQSTKNIVFRKYILYLKKYIHLKNRRSKTASNKTKSKFNLIWVTFHFVWHSNSIDNPIWLIFQFE